MPEKHGTCLICPRVEKLRKGMCQMHYLRWKKYGDPNRGKPPTEWYFWNRVEITETCWLWTSHLTNAGYGNFQSPYLNTRLAHRISYLWLIGPIPAGLELDHLCRSRRCVNPDHLEPVTHSVNTMRGQEARGRAVTQNPVCRKGHAYTEANTYWNPTKNARSCRKCRTEGMRNRNHRLTPASA